MSTHQYKEEPSAASGCLPANSGSVSLFFNSPVKCGGTLLGGGGNRSLEFTSIDKEVVIDSLMGTVLGFALDSDRSKITNGIHVTHLALGLDTMVTLKITGHAEATDPKIVLDDVVLIKTKDGIDAHNITIKKSKPSDLTKLLSLGGNTESPHISLHEIFGSIVLPEKKRSTVGNQQQSYIYVLDEIKVTRHSKYLEEKQKQEKMKSEKITTVIQNPPVQIPEAKKVEHFKITDGFSFDESSEREDFKVYLLLFILLILIIIYLYKN